MSRSWPVFCAIALLFVLFLFPSAAHAANLLTINPGFDNGPPGGELPPGWVVFTGRMGENMWVEPAGTYGPSQVLVIDTKGQQNSGLRSEAIPAAAGERYEARARVYATPGNRTGLYIDFWNANRQRIAAKSVMSTTTNQWETLSVTMDAPEGTAYVSLILYSNATSGPGLVAWDDAMLIKDMSYIVYLTPDHEDYLYEVGETANIGVKIIQGGKPVEGRVALQYRISLENGTQVNSGVLAVEGGEATVPASLDKPGFLRIDVTVVGSGGSASSAIAVGFSPDQIRISRPAPDDFDEFWAGKKAALAAVPVEATLTPIPSNAAGIEAFDVQVTALGNPVSGIMAKPAGAKPGSLPAIITLHGAGVSSARVTTATQWAREGMLAFDINAHGIPNNQPAEYYANLAATTLDRYYVSGWENREEFYFVGMFLRVVRAIDFITSQPEWDGKTLILYGTSQGGAQALAGAGLDERVSFFVAGVPWMADYGGVLRDRPMYTDLTLMPADRAQRIRDTLQYFDTANFASRIKADGFFTVAFLDTTCPPTSVYAAKNAVQGKTEIFNDPLVGHTNTPEAIAAMREAVLRHIAQNRGQ